MPSCLRTFEIGSSDGSESGDDEISVQGNDDWVDWLACTGAESLSSPRSLSGSSNAHEATTARRELQHTIDCYAVHRISPDEIGLRLVVSNCIDIAEILQERTIAINPMLITVRFNHRNDGTVWFALHFSDLKAMDRHNTRWQMIFKHLDAHITLAYPSITLWRVHQQRLLGVVHQWIRDCLERVDIPGFFVGKLLWSRARMSHDRFISMDIEIERSDPNDIGGLHYWLSELSWRLNAECSQFPKQNRFHISIRESKPPEPDALLELRI